MPITQRNRAAAIETPLGPDVLVLKSFAGTEQLGRLFEFELELLSEDYNLDFDKLIGEGVTIRLTLGQHGMRYFNGKVSRLAQLPAEGGYARYQATVVPWLWLLTRAADCRIFQNKTVPDIIEEVFKIHGLDDYERRLSGTYQPWEYCVQYRETAFNFVSRLMEHEGIYYYFKHEQGKHLLVLADSPGAHEDFPGYEEIAYRPPDETDTKTEFIRQWTIQKELQTGTYAHTEFNFTKPKTDLQQKASQSRAHAHADLEVFDYPGEYEETNEGEDYAKIRMQEIQIGHETLRGRSDSHGLCSGQTFKLTEFPRQDQNRKYLIHSVTHAIEVDVFESGGAGKSGAVYECAFTVRPADEQYRPARITRKPVIQGVQSAIVTGPKGQEIFVDKYGRVKVQFHWDRCGRNDENSSCWVRVSQSWTGRGWGHIANPHIGEEVIVGFYEGDPDRPVIVGRLYNADHMPPYPLPEAAATIGMKSPSTTTTSVHSLASKHKSK